MRFMKASNFKKGVLFIGVAGLFAFNSLMTGSIKGKVSPSKEALSVLAESDKDTLHATIDNGVFVIGNAKPGIYKIVINAKPPYKNLTEEGVTVSEGEATDLGEI